MTANPPLILYTRTDCHLCEVAAELLENMGLSRRDLDIDEDPRLEACYGLRVPVLRHPITARELDFPFGEADVRRFLEESVRD